MTEGSDADMKKLICRVLSIITMWIIILTSILPTMVTAYAAENDISDQTATPDTPESSLIEQTLTAAIYKNK